MCFQNWLVSNISWSTNWVFLKQVLQTFFELKLFPITIQHTWYSSGGQKWLISHIWSNTFLIYFSGSIQTLINKNLINHVPQFLRFLHFAEAKIDLIVCLCTPVCWISKMFWVQEIHSWNFRCDVHKSDIIAVPGQNVNKLVTFYNNHLKLIISNRM